MDKIKTPVVVHSTGSTLGIKDETGRFTIRKTVNSMSREAYFQLLADFEQIADALNTAADQSRVIEVMTEALEHLVDAIDVEMADPNNESRYMPIQTETAIYEAASALAEAARIMEGK